MRVLRRLLSLALLETLVLSACAVSNGDAPPGPLVDASARDATAERRPSPPSPPKDAGAGEDDAAAEVDADGATTPPSSADVRIGEVYVDRVVAGAATEYIELRGPKGIAIDDLFLRIVDDDGNPTSDIPIATMGQTIGETGTWVIATNGLPSRVDCTVPLKDWNLDARGAIVLRRGAKLDVVDAVAWTNLPGGGGAPPEGEGQPYLLPSGTTSFGRAPGVADTNDNRKDLCAMAQSAGGANGACN